LREDVFSRESLDDELVDAAGSLAIVTPEDVRSLVHSVT
jgi:hypothetical protein